MNNKHLISLIIITGFLGLMIVAQSCKKNSAEADTTQKYVMPDSLARILKYDTIRMSHLINTVTLSGKVDFNEDKVARIYPMVSGTVQGINVMLGDAVSAGQVLGVIKSSEMAGYSNDLVNAKSNLSVAKKNLDATQDMAQGGLASQKDLLASQAAYEQAQSELNRVQNVLKINGGGTNGDYVMRSPVSGFVVEKSATDNMAIRADNSTNLFTIADLKNVWIIANVYESNISLIHLNDDVDITTLAYPEKVFKGKVDKVMNVLDPVNKVMKIRIILPNPDYLLKPEMFANVAITNKESGNALSVQPASIIFDHSQNYVLVYHSNSDIRITPVKVIATTGDTSYITGDVKAGDIVIETQAILIYQMLNN
jgi:cobalt-zinc-cadmium efflux system membrane fusion protein